MNHWSGLTDGAEAVLVVGLLQSEGQPMVSPRAGSGCRDGPTLDGMLLMATYAPTVVSHHIRVQVIVRKLHRRRRITDINPAVHLPVHPLRLAWRVGKDVRFREYCCLVRTVDEANVYNTSRHIVLLVIRGIIIKL